MGCSGYVQPEHPLTVCQSFSLSVVRNERLMQGLRRGGTKAIMPNRDKVLLTIVALITAAVLLSSVDGVHASDARGQFDRNFNVNGPVTLNVENGSGSVNVRRGGSGSVSIHAEIRANNWFGGGASDSD